MKRLSERIREDGITITSIRTAAEPLDDPDAHRFTWYSSTLHLDGRKMTVPYGVHPLAPEPELNDVIDTIVMGVRSVYYAQSAWTRDAPDASYLAWCDEWGFDHEDEQRESMYAEWLSNLSHLRVLLGSKFDAYMDDTESDI